MTPMQKFCCAHQTTAECDQHGYAICLACGGAIVMRLTRYVLNDALLKVIAPKTERPR